MKRFLLLCFLVIVSRLYDGLTTYLYIPNLENETNIIVSFFEIGWTGLLIYQVILVFFIFCFLYYYMFKFKPLLPNETNLTLKQFISFLCFENTQSFNKIFYKTPKKKNTLFAFIGYTVSMTLISVGFIVGTSTMFLIISDTYRNFYGQGIPLFLYGFICLIALFYGFHFFRVEYEKYKNYSQRKIV